ncbi:polygalacturonase-like [Cylas formicarius]|uniref:polygalacturonase-like n=1 Tax=Cylas formicarius TaxID=197179 RepID=UPI0029587789|nr:polygalacturonase-like [Cylas formicarius]
MKYHGFVLALSAIVAAATPTGPSADATCTVTNFDDVANAVSSCTDLVIQDLTVPAGKALQLDLKSGTKLTFKGTIKFDFLNWEGPLLVISGSSVTVEGSGATLNGQGEKYWDGKGGSGTTKPVFVKIKTKANSVLNNVNLLNCPERCVSINADDTNLNGWNIDVSAGDTQGGHNTDGFDVSNTNNLHIDHATVQNQDDCVAVNQGTNMVFSNLDCSGGHGLSISVGLSSSNGSPNTVSNITFTDSKVRKSANGLHIKTHPTGGTGAVKDVTYNNIVISDITNYGIEIQEDYGDVGNPKANIPITNLILKQYTGTVSGSKAKQVSIVCASGGCSNWNWDGVSISGAKVKDDCNFQPNGYKCNT